MKKPHPQIEQLKMILRSLEVEFFEEFRFHPVRMWRFDLAVPSHKIALEYHGHAGFQGGKVSGHSTIKGLTNDCEKITTAQVMGWRVAAFTALHFIESKRVAHKLTNPFETISKLIDRANPRVEITLT